MFEYIGLYEFCLLSSVLVTLFLEFCFREGNIFEFWLPFVARLHFKIRGIEIDEQDNHYDWLLDNSIWTKPLGGCVVCFGFWVSCVSFYTYWDTPVLFIFGVLLSNFLIRFFYDKIV